MNRVLYPIVAIVFIDVLGFTLVMPLLPLYSERFGASPATVGMILSLYAVCALIAAPFLGRWSDVAGRRKVLLICQGGTLLSFLMLAWAPTLAWIFAARALDGITAGNVAIARAFIADRTPPKERAAAFGLITAAFGFGYFVGPALAGVLAGFSPQLPFWFAAGVSAASIVGTWRYLPRDQDSRTSRGAAPGFRELVKTPGLAAPLAQLCGFLLAFSCFTGGFALFCERRLRTGQIPFGMAEVGFVLAYIGILGLLSQLVLLRPLVAKWGERRLMVLALMLAASGYAGLSIVQSVAALSVAVAAIAVGNSLCRPALLAIVSNRVASNLQGAVNGFAQSLQSASMIVGPLIAGAVIQLGWLSGWALICGGVLALALLIPMRAGVD